jgi:5-hydroxyisourate hydrolase-like protein (transthyretin family)
MSLSGIRLRRAASRVVLASVFLAAISILVAPAAWAAGGDITGHVVDVTTGKPVSDLTVFLFDSSNAQQAGDTKTDASGQFTFTGIDSSAGKSYVVVTNYKGSHYESAAVSPGASPAEVKVYDLTTDPSQVTLDGWVVWIDRQTNGVSVQQDLQFKNRGDRGYVGKQLVAGQQQKMPATVFLPLAPGASNFEYLGQFQQCCGAASADGKTFVHSAPILPGDTSGTLRYVTQQTPTQLTFPVTMPTAMFSILVPEGVTASSDQLQPGQPITDRGNTYQTLIGTNLKKGDVITVDLQGLSSGSKTSKTGVLLIAIAVVAALGAAAIWLMAARRRAANGGERAPKRKTSRSARQVPRGEKAPVEGAEGATAAEAGSGDPELILDEIAALDLAHEQGLMEEETYTKLRAAAKSRLVQLRAGADRS